MGTKAIKFVANYFKNAKNYDQSFQKLKFLSIGDGKCTAEMKVEEIHVSAYGNLHGGCSSTMMDTVSLFGVSTHKKVQGFEPVSVDLHLTFVKGAKVGDEVLINSKTTKVGKSLAFSQIEMFNKKTNALLIKGTQAALLTEKKNEM